MGDEVIAEGNVLHRTSRTASILVLRIEQNRGAPLGLRPAVFKNIGFNQLAYSHFVFKQVLYHKGGAEIRRALLPPRKRLEHVIATEFDIGDVGCRVTTAPQDCGTSGFKEIIHDLNRADSGHRADS